jgi:transaldolase
MKFFLDSADLSEVRRAMDAGLIDGMTTNPSLLAKAAGEKGTPRDILRRHPRQRHALLLAGAGAARCQGRSQLHLALCRAAG